MRRITAAQASRPAWLAFFLAAWNSGLSTNLRIVSVVGFSLGSRGIGKLAAFWISSSPASTIARILLDLVVGELEPLGERRADVVHRPALAPGRRRAALRLELDLVQALVLLRLEASP